MQSARIIRVPVLSGLLEKTLRTHVLLIQKLRQTFYGRKALFDFFTVTLISSNLIYHSLGLKLLYLLFLN